MTDEQRNNPDGTADQTQQQAAQPAQQETKPKITGHIKGGASLGSENRPAAYILKEVAAQAITEDNEINEALILLLDYLARESKANTLAEKGLPDQYTMLRNLLGELDNLWPYLEIELRKPEYAGMSFADLAQETESGETFFQKAVTAAHSARDADKEKLPRAAGKKAKNIEFPLDKPNAKIWNLLETDTKGQILFDMKKSGTRTTIPALYSINFDGLSDELHITKRLLPFDKRVYLAISALFNAGNNIISLPLIYYAMGYTGKKPGQQDYERINESITKMTTARISFDNEQEAKKYKYDHFKYDGSLLPIERGTAIINGQLADAAIHIFREPPLVTFAKNRGQITTINVNVLQSKVNKTNANLLIDDYLIERISRAKKGKNRGSARILYETLFHHVGIADRPKTDTEKKQKKRAPKTIRRYLDHYKETGFISEYTVQNDGFTIYWNNDPHRPQIENRDDNNTA